MQRGFTMSGDDTSGIILKKGNTIIQFNIKRETQLVLYGVGTSNGGARLLQYLETPNTRSQWIRLTAYWGIRMRVALDVLPNFLDGN